MNFNHSEIVYLFERSRSVLDSTNYLIVSLSSEYRGLFASCGGRGEGKMEARGERWEGEASRLFPLSIIHLALSIFKSLPFLMDTQREPLQRSELQYSFLLFFLLVEIDKKYCLPIDLVVFSFFFLNICCYVISVKKGEGEGERSANGSLILSPQSTSLLPLLCELKDIVLFYIYWRWPSETIFFSFFCKRTPDNIYKQA